MCIELRELNFSIDVITLMFLRLSLKMTGISIRRHEDADLLIGLTKSLLAGCTLGSGICSIAIAILHAH